MQKTYLYNHLTLCNFCLYYLLLIENKKNNNKKTMNTILFIMLAVIALSSYASGYLLSFKEKYKEWHTKLFKNDVKPVQWCLSRMINHNRYTFSNWVQLASIAMFLVISLLCLEDITIPLWLYIVILATTSILPEIIGWYCGKYGCDKRVRKECTKCGVDIPAI